MSDSSRAPALAVARLAAHALHELDARRPDAREAPALDRAASTLVTAAAAGDQPATLHAALTVVEALAAERTRQSRSGPSPSPHVARDDWEPA